MLVLARTLRGGGLALALAFSSVGYRGVPCLKSHVFFHCLFFSLMHLSFLHGGGGGGVGGLQRYHVDLLSVGCPNLQETSVRENSHGKRTAKGTITCASGGASHSAKQHGERRTCVGQNPCADTLGGGCHLHNRASPACMDFTLRWPPALGWQARSCSPALKAHTGLAEPIAAARRETPSSTGAPGCISHSR